MIHPRKVPSQRGGFWLVCVKAYYINPFIVG